MTNEEQKQDTHEGAQSEELSSTDLLEVDPFDTPEYQQFVEEMAKECSCEYDVPCDSLLAGGLCECRTIDYEEDDDGSHEIDVRGDLWFL